MLAAKRVVCPICEERKARRWKAHTTCSGCGYRCGPVLQRYRRWVNGLHEDDAEIIFAFVALIIVTHVGILFVALMAWLGGLLLHLLL